MPLSVSRLNPLTLVLKLSRAICTDLACVYFYNMPGHRWDRKISCSYRHLGVCHRAHKNETDGILLSAQVPEPESNRCIPTRDGWVCVRSFPSENVRSPTVP